MFAARHIGTMTRARDSHPSQHASVRMSLLCPDLIGIACCTSQNLEMQCQIVPKIGLASGKPRLYESPSGKVAAACPYHMAKTQLPQSTSICRQSASRTACPFNVQFTGMLILGHSQKSRLMPLFKHAPGRTLSDGMSCDEARILQCFGI